MKKDEREELRSELARLQRAEETQDTLDKALCLADKMTDPLYGRSMKSPTGRAGRAQQLLRLMSRDQRVIADATMGRIWHQRDVDLLTDALLLVHHLAYFILLPTLPKGTDDYNWLLNSFRDFAGRLPREQERYRIMGMYWDEKGDRERAEECYAKALEATPVDSSEYMNALQRYWTELIAHGKAQKAWRVIGEALERAGNGDLEELKTMVTETVGHIVRGRKGKTDG